MDNVSNDDEFWSVAMLPPSNDHPADHVTATEGAENKNDNEEIISTIQSFTILPPDPSHNSLTLNLHMNCNDGILSDVSGIPWDAALILSGHLFGTCEGRQLCYNACFQDNSIDGMMQHDYGSGGILELGSGLGIVGLAAAAAAWSVQDIQQNERDCSTLQTTEKDDIHRVVLTDRNSSEILSHLRKNVVANLDSVVEASCHHANMTQHYSSLRSGCSSSNGNDSIPKIDNLAIAVEPCDWMDVSEAISNNNSIRPKPDQHITPQIPSGPFKLILGSALVYLPDHACACANTLFYYLTFNPDNNCNASYSSGTKTYPERQAVILQLPDRSGFTTHFLPRCHELGLAISCRELSEELVERVQQGWNRNIPSASDYRLYFITTK